MRKLIAVLTKRITEENPALRRVQLRLEDYEAAGDRVKELVGAREATYARVFNAALAEQKVLIELYESLMERLRAEEGSLKKLVFSVARIADVEAWARAGEALLDLRQRGPFKGKGSLAQIAETTLRAAWEMGSSSDVTTAMAQFRAEHQAALLEHSPVPKSDQADYHLWTKSFAKRLYGTDHIRIQYGIEYDGTDSRKLSPGTRGIVLLLPLSCSRRF